MKPQNYFDMKLPQAAAEEEELQTPVAELERLLFLSHEKDHHHSVKYSNDFLFNQINIKKYMININIVFT